MSLRTYMFYAMLALVLTAAEMAFAKDGPCQFVNWGHPYYEVTEEGTRQTYSLNVSGPNREMTPFGYHAPGILKCPSCGGLIIPNGLFQFFTTASLEKLETKAGQKYPASSAERMKRHAESFGYPIYTVEPEHLIPQASRDGILVGPLSGYAVVYRISDEWIASRFPEEKKPDPVSLLVLALSDSCVHFETTLIMSPPNEDDKLGVLDKLLSEISMNKTSSFDAPGTGPVTMPRGPE